MFEGFHSILMRAMDIFKAVWYILKHWLLLFPRKRILFYSCNLATEPPPLFPFFFFLSIFFTDILSSAILAWSLWQHVTFSLSSEQYSFVRLVFYITGSIDLNVSCSSFLILSLCHRTVCVFLFAILGPCVSVCVTWHCLTHSLPDLLLRFQPLRLFSPTHCQAYCRGQPLRFFSLTPFSTYGRGLAIETLLTRLTLVMLLSSLWQDYQLHLLVIESEAGLSIPASWLIVTHLRVTHPGPSSLWSTAVVSSHTRQLTSFGSSTLWRRKLSTRWRRRWRLYESRSRGLPTALQR